MCFFKKKSVVLFDKLTANEWLESCIKYLKDYIVVLNNSAEDEQKIKAIRTSVECLELCSKRIEIMLPPSGVRVKVLIKEFEDQLNELRKIIFNYQMNNENIVRISAGCSKLKASLDKLLNS